MILGQFVNMKMRGSVVYRVYIADGFKDDCERIIAKCMKSGKVTYEVFCELWKEMNFATLYKGRSSGAEIAELSEELVFTAKRLMLSKSAEFEKSVASLFILYALVTTQPFAHFATLRLIPDDIPAVFNLEDTARRTRRLDVLYILASVLVQHTQYHAAERERGMEFTYRKYLEGNVNIDRCHTHPQGVLGQQNMEFKLLNDMTTLTEQYTAAKEALSKKGNINNLKYVDSKLAMELNDSLKAVVAEAKYELQEGSSSHASDPQAIKTRAMKRKVEQMRHLVAVNERNKTVETITDNGPKRKVAKRATKQPTPNTSASSSKSSPGTTKSPTNVPGPSRKPPSHATKRKITRKGRWKPRKIQLSESDTEDSDDLSLRYDDSDEDSSEHSEPPDDKRTETQSNLQIDMLPCLITTEQDGRTFEIEIIDKLASKAKVKKDENNEQFIRNGASTSK